MKPIVNVYSAAWCSQCPGFKKMLEARGVEFVDKSLDINSTENMSEFLNLGFKALPAIHILDQEGNTLFLGTGTDSLDTIVTLYNS